MESCECWCDCIEELGSYSDEVCDDCFEGFHPGDLSVGDFDFLDLGGEA